MTNRWIGLVLLLLALSGCGPDCEPYTDPECVQTCKTGGGSDGACKSQCTQNVCGEAVQAEEHIGQARSSLTLSGTVGITDLGTFADGSQRCMFEGGSHYFHGTVLQPGPDLTGVQCDTLNSATLKLNGKGSALRVHRVLRAWSPSQVTYQNAATGTPWAANYAVGSGDIDSAYTSATAQSWPDAPINVDVKDIVAAWLGGAPNRGFLVRMGASASDTHFWPTQASNALVRPTVELDCTNGPQATCGDGSINGAEACDDGDTSAGDGCSATCAVESGWSCTGEPSSCSTTCGDGITAGLEECDDGNAVNEDACSNACEAQTCVDWE